MKSKKSRSGIAAFMFTLCALIFAALTLGAMFVFKDMMKFLLIYGTFIAPVVITLLFVFIDRMEHRLSANGSPAMIIIFVAHAICLAIVSPVLSCTLGWPIMGFEEYSLGEQIAGCVIVSIFCGGIVFAIQVALIRYACDNWFFTYETSSYTYTPSPISSQSNDGAPGYTEPSYSSSSSYDEPPKYYGVSNEDGDNSGFLTKNAHEDLDDLSGSFYGTKT